MLIETSQEGTRADQGLLHGGRMMQVGSCCSNSTVANSVKYVDDSIEYLCTADAHDSQIQVATDQAADWTTRNRKEGKRGQDEGNGHLLR